MEQLQDPVMQEDANIKAINEEHRKESQWEPGLGQLQLEGCKISPSVQKVPRSTGTHHALFS